MHKLNKSLGFSLVEMLVALVILAVGLLGLAGFQSKMMSEATRSKETSIAEMLAKEKMEELRQKGYVAVSAMASSASETIIQSNYSQVNLIRTVSIASGPAPDSRLVTVLITWQNSAGDNKSFELKSYIAKYDPKDFVTSTAANQAANDPIATIREWTKDKSWGKDVIVKYKDPTTGTTKYYISESQHYDDINTISKPSDSNQWTEAYFLEGKAQWRTNNLSDGSICEIRLQDEATAFVTKPKNPGSGIDYDISKTVPSTTARRCSPNLISGSGMLQANFACALKVTEINPGKSIFLGCGIEGGQNNILKSTVAGAYKVATKDIVLSICEGSGTCAFPTPSPTPLTAPSPTPVPTVTPTPEPGTTPLPTAEPISPATINIKVNLSANNKDAATSCTMSYTNSCSQTTYSTAVSSNSTTRVYSDSCSIIAPYTEAVATAVCKRDNNSTETQSITIKNGETYLIDFNIL
ncbi:prepilin-type N-terminal cleavage/methylation domain-containing protein [Chitinibacter sp. SCUT-21]|uniref:type IV pilus modification PilV family protein n=1 Tax=Chitinibacter sp. SCUT-21 TaxID=2970891 RepID=UPI0035A5A825